MHQLMSKHRTRVTSTKHSAPFPPPLPVPTTRQQLTVPLPAGRRGAGRRGGRGALFTAHCARAAAPWPSVGGATGTGTPGRPEDRFGERPRDRSASRECCRGAAAAKVTQPPPARNARCHTTDGGWQRVETGGNGWKRLAAVGW